MAGDEGRIRYTCKWESLSEVLLRHVPDKCVDNYRTLRTRFDQARTLNHNEVAFMGLQILVPKAEQQLRDLARPLVSACPDLRQMARETAITVLKKHGHAALDPDHVHLNRFMAAQSSPRTFSGWQHHDAPFQSYTLPQLVMHRFDVNDQDNSDLLSYLSGFYTDGPDAEVYDEHNEIPIAPKDVLDDFWDIDFSSAYHEHLDAFWHQHADGYRTLAKINFLAKVVETCAADPTSDLSSCARQVAQALTGHGIGQPSLKQLNEEHRPDAGFRVCTFDIGGHVASDFLRIELPDGRQLLYTPGEVDALHLFADRKALYWWVLNNTNEADNRARFVSHFALSSRSEREDSTGLNHMIDLLFFNWGGDDHHCLNQLDKTLPGDAFSHLRDAARQRMTDDANFALRSNDDLRKQLWIGYLKAFGKVFSPLAALDWPVALAAVGAGLVDIGLNIDQAVNGHTTGERHAGVIGAIFAAIDTLFNAAMLASAAGSSVKNELVEVAEAPPEESPPFEVETAPASPEQIETWVPGPFRPAQQAELLAPFESNVVLHGNPGDGQLAGIHVQDGNFYALISDTPYQVRFISELKSWVVIDPENPYSFYRNVPISRDAAGHWQPQARPRLSGGGGLPRKLLGLWGRSTHTASEPLPPTPYEVPDSLRSTLRDSAIAPGQERLLSGIMAFPEPAQNTAFAEFRKLRDTLAKDAQQYLASAELPARPQIPRLPREASAKQIIRSVYENSDGLVIGESHSQVGSKAFLIDNMTLLKKAKVRVLYLEHFMTEFQQADLDLFHVSGEMPPALKRYAQALDKGFGIDASSRYTFLNLLQAAQKEGIRIQSIDCMASYRQAWERAPSQVIRQQMMNFFAHEIIEADQATRGLSKWVALMGNSHSNTFEGVTGLSELQGAIGLRVEDIALSEIGGVEVDPGYTGVAQGDLSVFNLKGDLRLQVPTAIQIPSGAPLENLLRNTGTFTFDSIDGQLNLINRGRNGLLKYTPVLQEGDRLYLDRADWPWISGRRLASLQEMRSTLVRQGMRYIMR
ncbi:MULTISPECIES: membrane-targeted effector domain-containing toxin [unclassified Pseudomonas]|uniref:membrane-targeted effector domain-containing toxin n=1 Tax=unclassified Pseudomonas TaxID=196821 RepID=UPI002115C04E|nr:MULTISPECIES: membrane-targeted effector domain-containing toxin [unclassified Pseudomonas]